jgi:hypothetical protein
MMQRWTVITLLLLAAGCSQADPIPAPGPVSLRGDEHMTAYLAGAKQWKMWYVDEPEQFWKFEPDGTFAAWIEGDSDSDLPSLFSPDIPAGATKLTGTWQATTTQLQLSEIVTSSGDAVEPLTLDLKWVDGKLRIEIGGHHYMRRM